MDKNVPQAAARQISEVHHGSHNPIEGVPISIVVNARGRMCMLHSKPFGATPVWIKYLTNKRKVKIVFDNGVECVIDYLMDDKLHKLLLNVTKLFLIRMENGMPVEGYDTNLIKE
ncbi:MAG: hypothetical protein HY053_04270 [Proteobacteria bacterium]|nr:hypothetical protein [Pseudomonadota bacterium]